MECQDTGRTEEKLLKSEHQTGKGEISRQGGLERRNTDLCPRRMTSSGVRREKSPFGLAVRRPLVPCGKETSEATWEEWKRD